MTAPRKVWLWREQVLADGETRAARPVVRAAVALVVANPFAGTSAHDLTELIEAGPALARAHLPDAVALLSQAPIAYGKAAVVGLSGEVEHGAALLHPRLGAAMRAAVGGGTAIIPSACKVASAGAHIDVPLGHKDDVWSFNELDTLTLGFADAPRPGEILLVLAVSDGGRALPRIPPGRQAPNPKGTL